MELSELIDKLNEFYGNNKENEKEFEETINFLIKIYNRNEDIRSLVDFGDLDTLCDVLLDGYKTYLGEFGSCTNHLMTLASLNDYTKLREYIIHTCNELTNLEIDSTDPQYTAKVNMVYSFYNDVYNGDFKNVLEYTNNCRLINQLYLTINNYRLNVNKKSK